MAAFAAAGSGASPWPLFCCLPSIGHPLQFEIIKVETSLVELARGIESDCFEGLGCGGPGDELNGAIGMNFRRRLVASREIRERKLSSPVCPTPEDRRA
jgi:hypothetical protein